MDTGNTGIEVPVIHNLRDVGGLPIAGGNKVRTGVLFRSAQLGDETPATLDQLSGLGIEVVFDLRSDNEALLLPDVVPHGVELVRLDVLADSEERIAAQLEELFVDPVGASAQLISGRVQDHYLRSYRNLVSLESAQRSYSTMFAAVSQGASALFHCTAGKDRTGWAAASLQLLLGVPERDVFAHYMASNGPSLALFAEVLDVFEEAGGNRAALEPVFRVEPEYLAAAIDEATSRFGSIEGYFRDALGMSPAAIQVLREHLISAD